MRRLQLLYALASTLWLAYYVRSLAIIPVGERSPHFIRGFFVCLFVVVILPASSGYFFIVQTGSLDSPAAQSGTLEAPFRAGAACSLATSFDNSFASRKSNPSGKLRCSTPHSKRPVSAWARWPVCGCCRLRFDPLRRRK